MIRNILILVAGLLLGAITTAYFLGAPKGKALPGVPLKPLDATGDTSGRVAVTIEEKFFDSLLGTIFQQLGPPQLKLSQNFGQRPMQPIAFQNSCNSVLALNPAGNTVKNGVRITGCTLTAQPALTWLLCIQT